MAIRYTQKKKDEVVNFVRKYNETHGRGGQSAAVAKWSINPITVKSWLVEAGVATPGRKAKGRRAIRPSAGTGGSIRESSIDALRRMTEIQDEIAALESEFRSLKALL